MLTHTLGYPRIGASREMKKACERYWSGSISEQDLLDASQKEKHLRWQVQLDAGMDLVACNDFSLYDHVQDMSSMLGVIPKRFHPLRNKLSDMDFYFAMCRGYEGFGVEAEPLEMTKWFDTNYHYLVPEFTSDQHFCYESRKCVQEFLEAKAYGIGSPKPVLLGPVSYLLLGKEADEGFHRLDLLDSLLAVYAAILEDLHHAGGYWLQIDEPFLAADLDEKGREAYKRAFSYISQHFPGFHLVLATYFDGLGENLQFALSLPVETLHIDVVNGSDDLPSVFENAPSSMNISLGLVDGRNVWKNRIEDSLDVLGHAEKYLGKERVWVSTSCSLLHCPYDLDLEPSGGSLPSFLRQWLSFSRQKLDEVRLLADLMEDRVSDEVFHELADHLKAANARLHSDLIRNDEVRRRISGAADMDTGRSIPFAERKLLQQDRLKLPLLPVTMIGSLPQTIELRKLRRRFRSGELSRDEYDGALRKLIADAIAWQEQAGLDVLVHGEFERTDMVEYFGEHLDGIAFTANGWVQSYGSRAVKPPIIYGDVSRKRPITLGWTVFAQSCTGKPVKGMLTGPVTLLKWSFVRDDQLRRETALQLAFAMRDEVLDLERAGIAVIQIDEPGLREGLPLKKAARQEYLDWAVRAFGVTSGGVAPQTQIHTHLCYADYEDILETLVALDADVLTIETARSGMQVLQAFADFGYPNQLGPGIYDIHSSRVPTVDELGEQLDLVLRHFTPEQIWINPDCGLKTRKWDEVVPAIENMVIAARKIWESLKRADFRE